MKRLQSMLLAALALAAVLAAPMPATTAYAQDKYPNRPVRIVTAFAPGSVTDVVARFLAEQMRIILNQSVVVENKPGAFGIVAVEEMARSKPDGHTLMIGNTSTNTITQLLYPGKFSIDYDQSVIPVTRIAITPMLLIVITRDFPPKTFAELIAYAKQHPGKVRYGSTGVGQIAHYQMESFARGVGVQMSHIPNKQGSPGVLKDMLAGDVQATFMNTSTAVGPIRAGHLRPVAVMADKRLPEYPDVPTLAELGYPQVDMPLWAGMFAPAATPRDVLEILHAAVIKAINAEPMQEALRRQMIATAPTASLDEARTWIAAERARWKKIIAEVKVETE